MIYQYKCGEHGEFEVSQPITAEHVANCPECGEPAQRVFTMPAWIWDGATFRPDGSYRPESDYAEVMGR